MITLLLDSSNTKLAVAIAKNGEILGYKYYDAWQRQSEYMMSEINNLLKEHNIDPLEVGEIISSKGPGSYTGVRISLTIAKIWGFCRDIKVFAVSSLRILKKNDSPSLCVINARSSRSYVGIYHNDEVIMKDTILTNEEVLKLIEEQPNLVLCGETQYLKKEGYLTDIFEQMLKIRKVSESVEDILALKPVYLKN